MRRSRSMAASHDAGSVTLELAMALPSAVAVIALCLSGVHAVAVSSSVHGAALAGARAAAMGSPDDAIAAARRASDAEVEVRVSSAEGWVHVRVERARAWPWGVATGVASLPVEP